MKPLTSKEKKKIIISHVRNADLEFKTIIINHALYKIEENKVEKAKEILVNYKNKLQSEVDEFDKWAEVQSNIDTNIQLQSDKEQGK